MTVIALALLMLSIALLLHVIAEDVRASRDANDRYRAFVCELTIARIKNSR